MYRLEVFGRHDALVVDCEAVAGLTVGDGVGAAAYLCASAAVGARIHLVQAQIAFARYRHAECSVAEHLDAYQPAVRSAYILVDDGAVYRRHLVKIEFAGEHHHIGPLRVKPHRLYVGDVALR